MILVTLLLVGVVVYCQDDVNRVRDQVLPDIMNLGCADGARADPTDYRVWNRDELDTMHRTSGTGMFQSDDGSVRRLQAPRLKVPRLGRSDFQCLCDFCDEHCPCDETICKDYPWECGQTLVECGKDKSGLWKCYCDIDIDGFDVCWQNDWCVNLPPCTRSSDCQSDEVCVTTCCPGLRCLKKCELPWTPTGQPTPKPKPKKQECKQDGRWQCGEPIDKCGFSNDEQWDCICDMDVFGRKVCWQDDWCSNLITCNNNGDCPSGKHVCVPDTCCGVPKCFRDCEKLRVNQFLNPQP